MQRTTMTFLLVLFLTSLALAMPAPLAAAQRNVIVFFDLREDVAGVKNAVETIFAKMLAPGDQLIVQSPAPRPSSSPPSTTSCAPTSPGRRTATSR